ncbi:DUF4290 domain-containing protein [Chitinophaga horti]|uniref:DUF4290 domain-containing protein n=1 Tax=Chitinophaga horti TaxID=2920382 RepID=A0ABY6IZB4_9BACT|nr:DUF4290 domain-containing protein [Chitinophaga horti]UYQ92521.1 DUF4290 domain-containing protein [Chitinophaga horti]
MIMKEYGRNIQKMVEYLLSIKDDNHRQANAMALIELMGTLNPHLRNVEDFRHKLWDHLFLISDFKLNVESPYPIPTRETLRRKPERLGYPKKYPRNRHFGKNLEMVMDKAIAEQNPEKKEGFTQTVANYMKLAYSNWHKESVHDDAIRTELHNISKGQLEYHPGGGSNKSQTENFSASASEQQAAFRAQTAAANSSGSGKRKNYQKFKNNNNNNNQGGNKQGNKHNNNKYKNRNK